MTTKYIKLKPASFLQLNYLLFAFLIVIFSGCNYYGKQYTSPDHYNLSNPYIIKLPSELDNVSGIFYYNKGNSLFAESNKKGCLYKISLNKPGDIRKWKFSHKDDYEDIVLLDSTFYILNNNGDIVALNFLNDSISTHEYTFPSNGKNEFEALYFDDKLQKLVLICKDCDIDKKDATSAYCFDPVLKNYSGFYSIDVSNIAELSGPGSTKFKPSGATINPVTGELYILSAVNKLLAVADRGGVIKGIYHLDPKIFNHPEGITFAPSGNLFISNEAGGVSPADILHYPYKKGGDK